jgi:hypothetical protein
MQKTSLASIFQLKVGAAGFFQLLPGETGVIHLLPGEAGFFQLIRSEAGIKQLLACEAGICRLLQSVTRVGQPPGVVASMSLICIFFVSYRFVLSCAVHDILHRKDVIGCKCI